ncbi:hypothetical protein SteCoe_9410 [Stentor coeruleus]|uniref:Receptor expression-enhancing protein n=1 Tax=Stentor coeruleus TaxID=5963 RepID=A0A1R2CHZ2_9CILI|nr:hypothetical protein SteCoe_9410 [Stentor coeruleus]
MFSIICIGLICIIADFYPAYSSIKSYRESSDENNLKFWQKYWAVRSLFLLVDYIVWPYLEDFDVFYLFKVGIYISLSMFGTATKIYDNVICPLYNEVEPYADVLVQHTTLTQFVASWRGNLYKFFIEDLEEFLVPNS